MNKKCILLVVILFLVVVGMIYYIVYVKTVRIDTKANDERLTSRASVIRTYAELYRMGNRNSFLGVCENDDIVITIIEMEDISGKNSVNCISSIEAFAIEGKANKYGKYFCIDSTEQVIFTEGNSISTENDDFICGY